MLTVHLNILCNENQPDALFIFNLFRQSTSTCFGHVYRPSSGDIHCTHIAIKVAGSIPDGVIGFFY
jgi:hypothetical protein